MEGTAVVSAPTPAAPVLAPALVPVVPASVAASSQGHSVVSSPHITALVQVQPTAVQSANAPLTALALSPSQTQTTKLGIIKGKSSHTSPVLSIRLSISDGYTWLIYLPECINRSK